MGKIGLVIVNTGNGKGKTTAALGLLFRAAGQNLRTCVIQFIKSPKIPTGETSSAHSLGIEWHIKGDGFTWLSKDMNKTIELAQDAWQFAKNKIISGDYDMILLDEFTYLIAEEWISGAEVVKWIKENKPPELHLIITGRNASDELIAYADMVTEMRLIKHHFNKGVSAQPGIEY